MMVREARFLWDNSDEAFSPSRGNRRPDVELDMENDWPDDSLDLLSSLKGRRRKRGRPESKRTFHPDGNRSKQEERKKRPRHLADADWLHPRKEDLKGPPA